MNVSEPKLIQSLRTALRNLYGCNRGVCDASSLHAAHSFLIRFQGRNLRRKIQSIHQSERDSIAQDDQNHSLQDKVIGFLGDDCGSTFVACVVILAQPNVFDETERLFCAQTLLSRIRRMPIYQAVVSKQTLYNPSKTTIRLKSIFKDWEFEHDTSLLCTQQFTVDYWKHYLRQYIPSLSSYHPALGQSLYKYLGEIDANPSMCDGMIGEERIKCDVSLMLVACLIFIQIDWENAQEATTSELTWDPIISTLSSTIALFAFRLRSITVYNSSIRMEGSKYNVVKVAIDVLDLTRMHFNIQPAYFAISVCSTLAAIPDAIFGSPGGARGRLSIDPNFIRSCFSELNEKSQGIDVVQSTFYALATLSSAWTGISEFNLKVDYHLLIACEGWAKYITLPFHFVETTIPLVEKYVDNRINSSALSIQRIAISYIIRLYEGASMDAENVQAMYLAFSPDQTDANDQDGKKRQSSKSKRRVKERIESATSQAGKNQLLTHVHNEVFERGEVACQSSVRLWTCLFQSVDAGLENLRNGDTIDGEGAVGCLIACISACVPHIIKFSSELKFPFLLQNLLCTTGKISCSPSRDARSFSIEILILIHTAISVRTSQVIDADSLSDFDKSIAIFLCNCCLQLAQLCKYPSQYFNNMTEESDEKLEIERNDIRDVLRSLCNVENSGDKPSIISLFILESILEVCHERLCDARIEDVEPFVHILSSLAKPINWIATNLLHSGILLSRKSLKLIISSFYKVFCGLLGSWPSTPAAFPTIRLTSLAIASFSPTFHGITMFLSNQSDMKDFAFFYKMLGLSVCVAVESLQKVPELFGDNSQALLSHLNIRGAMRAPGGEDHVSCIALMRLSSESDYFSVNWLNAAAKLQMMPVTYIPLRLIEIYDELKLIELRRGPGIDYGQGVCPKTRRILINTIARLLSGPMKDDSMSESARTRLHDTFRESYENIIHMYDREDVLVGEKMFYICEWTFDIASFPPELINLSLCQQPSIPYQAFSVITEICLSGYGLKVDTKGGFLDRKMQWCRLRAAMFTLLQECIKSSSLPKIAVDSLIHLTIAECDAINSLLQENPEHLPSFLLLEFDADEIIIPTGAFLRIFVEYYEVLGRKVDEKVVTVDVIIENVKHSLQGLSSLVQVIRSCLCSSQPEPKYVDPRITVAEVWFQTLSRLVTLIRKTSKGIYDLKEIQELLHDSLAVALQIIFWHEIEDASNHRFSIGMSVDGPHIIAMIDYLQNLFHISGMNGFLSVARHFNDLIPLKTERCYVTLNEYHLGGFIVCAALFRAFSGALPSYIIENAADLYFALFCACGNMDFFDFIMVESTQVQICGSSTTFHNLRHGDKLAGHIVQTNQIQQLRSMLKTDADWRLMKGHIKSACGGKKKSTSFANKPTMTMWQFDRV